MDGVSNCRNWVGDLLGFLGSVGRLLMAGLRNPCYLFTQLSASFRQERADPLLIY